MFTSPSAISERIRDHLLRCSLHQSLAVFPIADSWLLAVPVFVKKQIATDEGPPAGNNVKPLIMALWGYGYQQEKNVCSCSARCVVCGVVPSGDGTPEVVVKAKRSATRRVFPKARILGPHRHNPSPFWGTLLLPLISALVAATPNPMLKEPSAQTYARTGHCCCCCWRRFFYSGWLSLGAKGASIRRPIVHAYQEQHVTVGR